MLLAETDPGSGHVAIWVAVIGALAVIVPSVVSAGVSVWQARKTRAQNTDEHRINAGHIAETAERIVRLHERVDDVGTDARAARTAAESAATQASEAKAAASDARAAAADACQRIENHERKHHPAAEPVGGD